MERNTLISDDQVATAVKALAEIAGSSNTGVAPETRVRAAETLLAHALVFPPADEPTPGEEA